MLRQRCKRALQIGPMPSPVSVVPAEFDQYYRKLASWLHANLDGVRSLTGKEVQRYSGKRIVAGWEVHCPGSERRFFVLVDQNYPFSRIGIAYPGDDLHLKWPHAEENNFLCLPANDWSPIEQLEHSIGEQLQHADELVDNCACDDFIRGESAREFLSYWGRHADHYPSGPSALSLIDVYNLKPRAIRAKPYRGMLLLGEDESQLKSWIENCGMEASERSIQATFAFVDQGPTLPLPNCSRTFIDQFVNQVPDLNGIIGRLCVSEPILVIFAARGSKGIGLFGAEIQAARTARFGRKPKARVVKMILSSWGKFRPIRVARADSGWVHGRDQDIDGHHALSQCHVVVLGTGSLGSQVASRLAQAGVGRITLVDPQPLASANIGRHALGIDCLNQGKATALAEILSKKYPHGAFRGLEMPWQQAIRQEREVFSAADLVVGCMGEVEQDLSWDSFHQSEATGKTPTVYGWLGTQGATGHALALLPDGPALSCFLDCDGYLRSAETHFEGGDQMRVEPACGTEFQPYGPLAAGQVELLVTRTCIDILTGQVSPPYHRIYACSSEDLERVGGTWTDHHMEYRPQDYGGPFEYCPPVKHCGKCYKCR